MSKGFVRAVRLVRDKVPDFARYPFSIPAVAALDELPLDPRVTILVDEDLKPPKPDTESPPVK